MPKFVPRQRKHKARDREKRAAALPSTLDTNATEILPSSKAESEARRRQLREELRAQLPKISSKKQKRLDKYIDTKLKKEENAELIRKLAATRVDTSLFQSTKKLGRVTESRREALGRALREREAGIGGPETDAMLFENATTSDEDDDGNENRGAHGEVRHVAPTSNEPIGTFGSGLKRPLDLDNEGRPIIKKRKRSKKKSTHMEALLDQPAEEEEWEGFSSGPDNSDDDSLPDDDLLPGSESDGNSNYIESVDDSDASQEGTAFSQNQDQDFANNGRKPDRVRTSAFKAWAEQQRNQAIGFTPSNAIADMPVAAPQTQIQYTPLPLEQEPLPPELQIHAEADRKAHAVNVDRSEEIQAARLALPIASEEQKIMEAVFNNHVAIISGPTGSGKTTQVPQFLYEAGFGDAGGPTPGMIGVTQPRRVAAISMAARVGEELESAKGRVSYQIRFDTTVSRQTAIKFMTDGVLLREMSDDFALKRYSAIVIDEAHERTVNTDILIALMSRCVKARAQLAKEKPSLYSPLKLIIMSATLRVSDFRDNNRLFADAPPLVQIEGRQYSVTPHWSRRTAHNYLEEMFKKVSRGHRKLPPGGILVFLTSQSDIQTMARKLRNAFVTSAAPYPHHPPVRLDPSEMPLEGEDLEAGSSANIPVPIDGVDSDSGDEITMHDDADDEFKIEGEESADVQRVHVLPLYSQLPSKEQLKVFQPPPEGSRLIVLATNVAETSLTIPGVRYVFDSGRAKERKWDAAGVQTFETTWISKASADQRMGRAGRTGPGHCYRLYSSALYESFADFAEPEIFRAPLEGVVLQLKSLNLSRVDNFPFPTPPDRSSLAKAETLLGHLGALDNNRIITPLGREFQKYPLNPRFAQMLRLGQLHNCIALTIAMVAVLDVPELFIPEASLDLRTPIHENDEEHIWTEADNIEEILREKRRKAYNTAHAEFSRLDRGSDAIKLLAAIYDYSHTASDSEEFCTEKFLRPKALKEASQLRQQLTATVRTLNPSAASAITPYEPKLPKPTEKQLAVLKQITAAGFIDQIAIRADSLPSPPPLVDGKRPRRAIDVRYKTLLPSHDAPLNHEEDPYAYLHPSSVLAHTPPSKLPRYIVYNRLQRSQPSTSGKRRKTRMFPLTPVSAEQLSVLARGTGLLEVGKPIGNIAVLERDGKSEERRECDVVVSLVGSKGELGWPLARKRVVQKRVVGSGWVVDRWLE